jgi:hypothetical protein
VSISHWACLAASASMTMATMGPAGAAGRARAFDRAPLAGAWRVPAEVGNNARGIDADRDDPGSTRSGPSELQAVDALGASERKSGNLRHLNECYETARRAARWTKEWRQEGPHCAER